MTSYFALLLPLTYALLGWGLCSRWKLPTRGLEGFAWAYGVGSGITSLGLLALVASGAWTWLDGVELAPMFEFLVIAIPAIAIAWAPIRSYFRAERTNAAPARRAAALRPIQGVIWVWLLLPIAVGFDLGWDALAYHLPAARRLATDGAGPMVGLLDGEFRLGFDVLFMPGLVLDGQVPRGPSAIHLWAGLALAAGIAAEAARRTTVLIGVSVGALFLLSPGIAPLLKHAYVDLGVGLYVFLALAAASRALRQGDRASVVAAGLFAGFAANAKLPAGATIAAVAVALLVGRGFARGARPAALATIVGLLVATPWFIRAWINTGNPFFPALLDRFGSGWADREVVESVKQSVLVQLGLPRDLLLPLRGVVHATFLRAGGFEAPPWVLAFLPAALLRPIPADRRGLLAGAIVLFVAWGAFVPVFRFGIGWYAWAAVAAAFGAARIARLGRPFALATGCVAVGVLALGIMGAWKARSPNRVFSYAVADQFGPAVSRFPSGADRPLGPIGISSSVVGLLPTRVIALEPQRNGVIRASDFDDPDRLMAACRRLGLRSLVLDDTTDEGRKAIACARAWSRNGTASVDSDERAERRHRVVKVVLPSLAPPR